MLRSVGPILLVVYLAVGVVLCVIAITQSVKDTPEPTTMKEARSQLFSMIRDLAIIPFWLLIVIAMLIGEALAPITARLSDIHHIYKQKDPEDEN